MVAGAPEEHRIGIVPRVLGAEFGLPEYAAYITSTRTIFVRTATLFATARPDLGRGDLIPALIRAVRPPRRFSYDWATVHPDALAAAKDSVTIPHVGVERVDVRFAWGSASIRFQVKGRRTFSTRTYRLHPPRDPHTPVPRDARLRYAKEAQALWQRALPPSVSVKSKWIP